MIEEIKNSEVILQWDPDHNPYGKKEKRKAIQIGLKGDILRQFGTKEIKRIDDITNFVHEQKKNIDIGELDKLIVPFEKVYIINSEILLKKIGADNYVDPT